MKQANLCAIGAALLLTALPAFAASSSVGQGMNVIAIAMFLMFVAATLVVTRWAARSNHSVADHYAAGGKITALQNGWAIAGDYMSAASLLGISALVFTSGYDGLIYSIGFLASWPIILFLIAEPLRNLGRFTLADVVSYRLQQRPIRAFSASSSIVIVLLYLVSQMVGAGKLVELLFGFSYTAAVVLVGVLMWSMCSSAACWPPPGSRSSRQCCCWRAPLSWRSW